MRELSTDLTPDLTKLRHRPVPTETRSAVTLTVMIFLYLDALVLLLLIVAATQASLQAATQDQVATQASLQAAAQTVQLGGRDVVRPLCTGQTSVVEGTMADLLLI